jgi:transcriptional regulator with XRE-family HTH domain
MGYRGKVAEQERARELRAQAWTLLEIAQELGVAKSSVSLWVRDVAFTPNHRRASRMRGPSAAQMRKAAEIEELLEEAVHFWSELTAIPPNQFIKPYRAVPDPSIRRSKHPLGCPAVGYACTRTHRAVMGLVSALLECRLAIPG